MDRDTLFRDLLKLYGDQVYRFALRLSGNPEDAADLTQDAFLRAFKGMDRYDASRPFSAWIYRILNNLYLNGLSRAERRRTESLDAVLGTVERETAGDLGEVPVTALERAETGRLLWECVGRIPYEFRAPLLLCDMEGMSYEEIGQALSCPLNTVRSRIHRARKALREMMTLHLKGEGS